MRQQTIIIIFYIFLTSLGFAQKIVRSTIGTLGASFNSNEVLIQSTAGQSFPTSSERSGEVLNVRQGFHQPFNSITLGNELNISVFPNPNNGNFFISTDFPLFLMYDYKIVDNLGKIIESGSGFGNKTEIISLTNKDIGIYHLIIKTFDLESNTKITILNN
jgi:hypothetical protein